MAKSVLQNKAKNTLKKRMLVAVRKKRNINRKHKLYSMHDTSICIIFQIQI